MTNDLKMDASRRDFTINSLYMKMIIDRDNIDKKQFTIEIYDPLESAKDIVSNTLRTPRDPYDTFMADARRISRILKMTVKILRMKSAKVNYANNLIQFIDNDAKFNEVKKMIEYKKDDSDKFTILNQRSQIIDDIIAVVSSPNYKIIINDLFRHKNLFIFFWLPPLPAEEDKFIGIDIDICKICTDISNLIDRVQEYICSKSIKNSEINTILSLITCYIHIQTLHIQTTKPNKNQELEYYNKELEKLVNTCMNNRTEFNNVKVILNILEYIIYTYFYSKSLNREKDIYNYILNYDALCNLIVSNKNILSIIYTILDYFNIIKKHDNMSGLNLIDTERMLSLINAYKDGVKSAI